MSHGSREYLVKREALLKDLHATRVLSFLMKTKKCTSINIFMLKLQIIRISRKNQCHCDQWHSLENICLRFSYASLQAKATGV